MSDWFCMSFPEICYILVCIVGFVLYSMDESFLLQDRHYKPP